MIYTAFKEKRFGVKALQIISAADKIIREYSADGYVLTLRQLYYQFVARDLLPNTEKNYKNLGKVVSEARLAGMLPWDMIEDGGRKPSQYLINEEEADVFDDIEYHFALDLWARQDYYVEVWVEKEALKGVIERPCRKLRVPHMACKGYTSSSAAWRAGLRFEKARESGREVVLIHLGDHDPSGIDMTRDNGDRVKLFSWGDVIVERIALNIDQVRHYKPPPNPAKMTDSRADDYVKRFGRSSWELDALAPNVIESMITAKLNEYRDQDRWDEALDEEAERRKVLAQVQPNWEKIKRLLAKQE